MYRILRLQCKFECFWIYHSYFLKSLRLVDARNYSGRLPPFSSSRSSEEFVAPGGLGHESFCDIFAATRLGLFPLSEFLFVIANKGTEFVEFRSAFLEPPPAKSCKADMRSFRHFDFG